MRSSMWFYGIAASDELTREPKVQNAHYCRTMQRNEERAPAMRMRKRMEATRGQGVLYVWRKLRQRAAKASRSTQLGASAAVGQLAAICPVLLHLKNI